MEDGTCLQAVWKIIVNLFCGQKLKKKGVENGEAFFSKAI
jgi:hypothetical protein